MGNVMWWGGRRLVCIVPSDGSHQCHHEILRRLSMQVQSHPRGSVCTSLWSSGEAVPQRSQGMGSAVSGCTWSRRLKGTFPLSSVCSLVSNTRGLRAKGRLVELGQWAIGMK